MTYTNIAIAQIEASRKIVGTHDWHSSQWFDKLADYASTGDVGGKSSDPFNVVTSLRGFATKVPNRINIQKLRDFLATLQPENMAADLKNAIIAHLDAVLNGKLRKGFRFQFSRNNRWRFMEGVSAASCFINCFEQAINYNRQLS